MVSNGINFDGMVKFCTFAWGKVCPVKFAVL